MGVALAYKLVPADKSIWSGRGPARLILAAICFCIVLVNSGGASAAPSRASHESAHAFLLRGFANVFSLGLDQFAPKLRQRGIRTEVYNHLFWTSLASQAIQEYKSGRTRKIILIGHSMGAVAVIEMVKALADNGVPVTLAATLDAAKTTLPGGHVGNFVNLYVGNGLIGGVVRAGPHFHGHVTNINLSRYPEINHISIADDPVVHNILLTYVARSLAVGAGAPVAAAPRREIRRRSVAAMPSAQN